MRRFFLTAAFVLACGSDDRYECVDIDSLRFDPTYLPTVDLLLVLDTTPTPEAQEAQLRLVDALPEFFESVRTLQDARVVDDPVGLDLHVGVLTGDMSTGHPTLCASSDGDGQLRTQGNFAGECSGAYPPFLTFGDDAAAAGAQIGCLVSSGCTVQQLFEATLKAVTPSDAEIEFFRGAGHADGFNAGFLRDTSILVIVMLSNRDDCSAADLTIFDTPDREAQPCAQYDALHPVSRYVEGLLATRIDPERVIFAPIVGIPTDLEGSSADVVLADPRMQVPPGEPRPLSCDAPAAIPPRRIVELAGELERAGATSVVTSLCRSDYDEPFARIAAAIALEIGTRECLSQPIRRNEDGTVPCWLSERAPAGVTCASLGRELAYVDEGEEHCLVPQIAPSSTEPGWAYDDVGNDCAGPSHWHLRRRYDPIDGSSETFHCTPEPVDALGVSCRDDTDCVRSSESLADVFPRGLTCVDSRCQARCTHEAHCEQAYECDRNTGVCVIDCNPN